MVNFSGSSTISINFQSLVLFSSLWLSATCLVKLASRFSVATSVGTGGIYYRMMYCFYILLEQVTGSMAKNCFLKNMYIIKFR